MKRAFVALALVACGAAPPEPASAAPKGPVPSFGTEDVSRRWLSDTHSPRPYVSEDARENALLAACGAADDALRLAAREAPEDAEALLRELGSPFVRPRMLRATDGAALQAQLQSMHTAFTRCGVAMGPKGVTVVTAEALADLGPLAFRHFTGAWLDLDATILVPAQNAKVVVLGPRGAPKTYPTNLDRRGHARGRFVLDRPGGFTVQLIADVEGGPRPLLEARVFADVPPMPNTEPAPGETEASLDAMITFARSEEGLAPLKPDPRLDALAAAHAEQMHQAGRLAHDVGDGDLADRFQREGYVAALVGENVAKAATLGLAHRALYASPSHRLNLLHAGYTRFGSATVTDGARIWVCEVFSSDFK